MANWLSSDTSPMRLLAGVPPERAELVESLFSPLVGQFGAMQQQLQQQMLDQFQQTLMMLLQMLSRMHRDDMALIREELADLRRLTQEQQALQAQLAACPPASGDRATPGSNPGRSLAFPLPPSGGPGSDALARAEILPESSRGHTAPDPPSMAPDGATPAAGRASLDESLPPRGRADQDIHVWLSRRITAIQDERQGRWQKILSSVMGKDTGKDLP